MTYVLDGDSGAVDVSHGDPLEAFDGHPLAAGPYQVPSQWYTPAWPDAPPCGLGCGSRSDSRNTIIRPSSARPRSDYRHGCGCQSRGGPHSMAA
jgi:hypothetical protein